MKKSAKLILIIVIVLFIAGMAFYPSVKKKYFSVKESPDKALATAGKTPSPGGRGNPLNIEAQIITQETLSDVIKATGSLIPDEEVDLSFETSGKITHIYFTEGSSVRKGSLLAKVNDSPLQAELKKLETQTPLAEDRVFRQKSLLAKDAVSKEAYEQVSTELEKLKADIELIKARIDQTELRAPFDGVIGLRSVSEGAYTSPNTVIAKLTRITPLKIEFSVNERYSNIMHPGTKLKFKAGDALEEHQASVYAIESTVDKGTRTLRVRATYPNPGGKLIPGLTASIEIQSNEIKNAITIPNQAIIAEMGRDIAYLYKGGKAQQVELIKGLRTESKMQIIKGISPGDTLITTGVMQLRDGLPVTIDRMVEK